MSKWPAKGVELKTSRASSLGQLLILKKVEKIMHDYLIVGGSISALSTAFVLKKKEPSLKVAVIGNFVDYHSATRCAGAMINCFAELPYDALSDPAMTKKYEMALESNQLWPEYIDQINEFSDEKLEQVSGKTYCLLTSKSTRIEIKTFDYILNTIGRDYDSIYEVDPSEIKGLKPTDLGQTMRAMAVPDSKIDPHKALDCLRSACKNLGVELFDDMVSHCETEMMSGKVKEVVCESGDKYKAKRYILAQGFDENKIKASLRKAKYLPIITNGGAALRLTAPDWLVEKGGLGRDLLELNDVIRMVDRGGACGIHVVPAGDNRSFYLGASSATWPNKEFKPKLAAVQVLMNSAINEISYELFHYDVELIGNGFRPVTPDGYPIIGGTSIENVWINNGMKRDGFTSCWAVAQDLVEGILSDRTDWGLFSPERKLISYRTREQAIESALEVYQGSFVQHYGVEMPLRIPATKDRHLQEIEGIYKKVKRRNFGIHPEMLHIYADNQNYKIVKPYL